jgi:NTP pyrophosphatase (non-canonical NTP hydrolase)
VLPCWHTRQRAHFLRDKVPRIDSNRSKIAAREESRIDSRSSDGGPAPSPTKLRGTMPDFEGHGRLTVQEYQAKAVSADQLPGDDLAVPLLGLFGETGSLLSEAKKKHRDAVSYTGYESTVIEELGDVLWYLTAVARRGGLSLGELAHNRDSSFADWRTDHALPFPFAALQRSNRRPDNDAEARETTDVRPGENRSPPGQVDRCRLNLWLHQNSVRPKIARIDKSRG